MSEAIIEVDSVPSIAILAPRVGIDGWGSTFDSAALALLRLALPSTCANTGSARRPKLSLAIFWPANRTAALRRGGTEDVAQAALESHSYLDRRLARQCQMTERRPGWNTATWLSRQVLKTPSLPSLPAGAVLKTDTRPVRPASLDPRFAVLQAS
jgi:hypothetical protein